MFLEKIVEYEMMLNEDEKSAATISKYVYEAKEFVSYLNERDIDKDVVIAYKKELASKYKPRTVNCKLIAVNSFLKFLDKHNCIVKTLKIQEQLFLNDDRILTISDYKRLLTYASKDFGLLLETMAATGIRVSELEYITVETVKEGKSDINCKGKNRLIVVPSALKKKLEEYIGRKKITSGPVFVTRNGKPLDRTNIWRKMKKICIKAGMNPDKVFPHNFRHLFARTFYEEEKDIVKLADVLGHSSTNTTRIYTMDNGYKHMEAMNRVAKLMILTT